MPATLPLQFLREAWAGAGWVLRSDWRLIDPCGPVRAHVLDCCQQEADVLTKEATADWCSLKAHAWKQLTTLGRVDVATALA